MAITAGERLISALRTFGVETVFGIPGAHTIEYYKHLESFGITHITTRHEQSAGYMADGFARASGRPGVCLIVAGPGVTNAATAIGTAYADSIPMLVISSVNMIEDLEMGRGHLHEIPDQPSVTRSLVRKSLLLLTPGQLRLELQRAFYAFKVERARPVHFSVPIDLAETVSDTDDVRLIAPFRSAPHPDAIDTASALLSASKRPMMIVGGGATGASSEVMSLAEKAAIPVITTIAGKGIIPETHPLSMGSTLQRASTSKAIRSADAIIAVGTQLSPTDLELWPHSASELASLLGKDDDLAPERLGTTCPIVRIDIDPSAMAGDHPADVAILGDAALSLTALADQIAPVDRLVRQAAEDVARSVRDGVHAGITEREKRHIAVLRSLREMLPSDGFVAADLCQLSYTGNVFFQSLAPRSWFYPSGYGPLGYALPAAIGGMLTPERRQGAVVIGDFGLQFTSQDLSTASELCLSLPVIVWNNRGLGEIKDWMRNKNAPPVGVAPRNPDFEDLAKAHHCGYANPNSQEDFKTALAEAQKAQRPTIIEVNEEKDWVSAP